MCFHVASDIVKIIPMTRRKYERGFANCFGIVPEFIYLIIFNSGMVFSVACPMSQQWIKQIK